MNEICIASQSNIERQCPPGTCDRRSNYAIPRNGHMGAEIWMVGDGDRSDVDIVRSKTMVENNIRANNSVSLESLPS